MRTERCRVGGWPNEHAELRHCEHGEDAELLAEWVGERSDQELSIDCETNARDPWQPGFRTRMVQVSDGLTSWTCPTAFLDADGAYSVGGELAIMVRDHPRWIAHYSEADERFLCRGLGLEDDWPNFPPNWYPVRWSDPEPHFWDTQVMLGVYDPRTVTTQNPKDRIHPLIPRPKGLKPTTTRLLSPALAAAEDALTARFREIAPPGHRAAERLRTYGFAHVDQDDEAYRRYGALDPLFTHRLYRLMRRALEARGQWERVVASLAEQWVVDGATFRGMDVDARYARWLDGELESVTLAQRPTLDPHGVGPSGIGPKVGRAFASLGVRSPVVDRDSGAESWNREALGKLAERGREALAAGPDERVARALELVEAVQQTRRADKYRSTWVRPMLRTVDECDGAMHASMRDIGAVTTRMTAQKSFTAGPLHSAPKREETRLRACVRAPRGWLYVSADLRQGEPHVMAALSGCPDYLAWLLEGDINGRIAAELYPDYNPAEGKVAGTRSFAQRQAVKFAWLAACYGARDAKVDALLGLPGSGVLSRWRSWFPRFWAYADWCNAQEVIVLDSGHRVPLWDRWWVNDAGVLTPRVDAGGRPVESRLGLNAATQGTQADVLKVAIHRHRLAGWHWALRFFMHDELVACVPAPMAEAYRDFLERAMTVTYRGVTIGCEAEVDGPTWMPQVGGFDAADLAALDEVEVSA